jgi:hypothetical protein
MASSLLAVKLDPIYQLFVGKNHVFFPVTAGCQHVPTRV